MIDSHKRDVVGKGQGLGKVDAHKQSADESGVRGDGHETNVREGQTRLVKRLTGDTGDHLNVGAACDLRHHAAVETVGVDLGRHNIGADTAHAVCHFHDGNRGLVAGAFHSKYVHNASFF